MSGSPCAGKQAAEVWIADDRVSHTEPFDKVTSSVNMLTLLYFVVFKI